MFSVAHRVPTSSRTAPLKYVAQMQCYTLQDMLVVQYILRMYEGILPQHLWGLWGVPCRFAGHHGGQDVPAPLPFPKDFSSSRSNSCMNNSSSEHTFVCSLKLLFGIVVVDVTAKDSMMGCSRRPCHCFQTCSWHSLCLHNDELSKGWCTALCWPACCRALSKTFVLLLCTELLLVWNAVQNRWLKVLSEQHLLRIFLISQCSLRISIQNLSIR